MDATRTLPPCSANDSSPVSSDGSLSASSSMSHTRRTRTVVGQSRGGCLTCKARRVKCDEQKPLCQRCLRAGRLCNGYGPTRKASRSSSPAALSNHSITPGLRDGVRADKGTERLCHLAAHVLSPLHESQPVLGDGVWGRMFLQLSNQNECVKAAAAAFGASYELWIDNNADRYATALGYYGAALARLRSALATGVTSHESVALTSMILACSEIMSQHEENAFQHFLGAVQIVHHTSLAACGKPLSPEIMIIEDELVQVDVLIGSYGLAQTPQVMHLEGHVGNKPSDHLFREPHLASNAAMHCLYQSRPFIDAASKTRYHYPSWKGSDSVMESRQRDLVSQLQMVRDGLATLTELLQSESGTRGYQVRDREVLADIYGLRTQITSTLIFVLCIHEAFQTAYDEQLELFQSIISDAAASSRLRGRVRASALKRFSTRPGVISPLSFTSMKCRDPSVRSLAIAMLKQQGREGPSDGDIMAVIGARVAELESPRDVLRHHTWSHASPDMPEELRIHGHGVFPGKTTGGGRRVFNVEFSRPKTPLSQGWGVIDYTDLSNWVLWKEPIEV